MHGLREIRHYECIPIAALLRQGRHSLNGSVAIVSGFIQPARCQAGPVHLWPDELAASQRDVLTGILTSHLCLRSHQYTMRVARFPRDVLGNCAADAPAFLDLVGQAHPAIL